MMLNSDDNLNAGVQNKGRKTAGDQKWSEKKRVHKKKKKKRRRKKYETEKLISLALACAKDTNGK